jgi:hypothetical protein
MKLILLLIALTTLSSSSVAAELNGVVKSEDGKPLAGVQVLTYAPAGPATILGIKTESSTRRHEVVTIADGSFKLPGHGEVVYFHRADLRPLTKIVASSIKHIEVTMEPANRTLWKLPGCTAADKTNRVGVGFMVTAPESVLVKKDEERFEEGGYLFGYRNGERTELLVNWWESTSLEPKEKYVLESTEFSQRMWTSGKKWGYDYRGTMRNGRLWRRVALRNGAIAYEANTKEAAEIFDAMIDGMCFDDSAVKW